LALALLAAAAVRRPAGSVIGRAHADRIGHCSPKRAPANCPARFAASPDRDRRRETSFFIGI
jgi:hypothetical protein